jgi:ankyrin repeat protein
MNKKKFSVCLVILSLICKIGVQEVSAMLVTDVSASSSSAEQLVAINDSGFTGLDVREVLDKSSEQMHQLMNYIVNDNVAGYSSMLKEFPQLISHTHAKAKTCVHDALELLSSHDAVAAGKFLSYIFGQREFRKFLPLGQANDEGNLPIHLIAQQLMILEGLGEGSIQRRNYEAALVIAQKIAGRQPNFLDRTNKRNQTPFDLLKGSSETLSLNALLCDDFDLSDQVVDHLRDIGEESLVNSLLVDFQKRRAEKIHQVEQLYICLKETPLMALDSTIKSNLHLLNTQDADQQDMVLRSVYENQISILRVLLENGAQASEAIYFACLWRKPRAVRVLSDAGVDVNVLCGVGATALHMAASGGDQTKELVSALVAAEADVNLKDSNGKTALHLLADGNYDRVELIKLLIYFGADVNLRDNAGSTALHLAAYKGCLPVVEALIAAGADGKIRCRDGNTAFDLAVRNGYARIGSRIVKATPGLIEGDRKLVFGLLFVCEIGNLRVLNDLISRGVNVNKKWDNGGMAALHFAALNGQPAVVERLVAAGANVNATDEVGQTALHLAAKKGKLEVVKRLLSAGADVNLKDEAGGTALSYCLYNQEVRLALIAGGAE